MTRLRFVVRGRVQGVGFRWFVKLSAAELGVTGWVRNRRDGAVEGEAQGPAERLARFEAKLRAGPSYARVDELETQRLEPVDGTGEFEISRDLEH